MTLRRLFNRIRFNIAFARYDRAISEARQAHGKVKDALSAKQAAVHAALAAGRGR